MANELTQHKPRAGGGGGGGWGGQTHSPEYIVAIDTVALLKT